MKLHKLKINNFCSYKSAEIDFDNLPKIILVVGKTGSGKTSLFVDSILFALFGITRNTDKRGLGIEYSIYDLKYPCEVSLSFEVENILYEITRIRGKINDSMGHVLEVKINDVPLDGYISEKQEIINKAIKLSYQTFLDVIMLQQDKGNDLIIKDSSSDIFENIIFLKTINNIKKIFNDRKKDLIKEKDNLKLYKYYDIGNFTKEELETNKIALEQKIQNINDSLKLEEEKYYNLNFSNQALLDEKVKIKENNILIEKKVSDSIVLCKKKISEIIAYYKEKSEKIKKFKGKCPACLKDLEGEDIQNLITFYKSKCDEDIKNIKENTRTNIQNLKSNIKIDNINNLDEIIKDIDSVSNIIKQYKSELEPLNNELEIVIDKINKIVNNKDINIKINELQAEIDKCEKLYELFGDKNIPSILAQKIFPILENKINNYLAKFSTDMLTKFTVTNKGKRNIQIQYNGKYRPYTSFSGGQQVCINMAARISSADIISEMLGTNIDTLILDEPFPSLDDEVTESFMDVINQMSKKYSHIIIITHVDSLKSMFDKHLEIVMQEGKSLIRS